MDGLLEKSRVAISLMPESLIVRAARDERVQLDKCAPAREGGDAVFAEVEIARRVLERAFDRWRTLIPLWRRLTFTMQHQEQTQWCWSATSVSVAAYYDPQTTWTQCEMVNAEKGQTTCCQDGSSSACNQPNVLNAPLDRADVLDHMQNGSVGYAVIEQEIDAGRPLAWRIGWNGGGGHFAVIEGYRTDGEEWVAVDDPWYGASDVAVTTLTGGMYQGSGSWTHTYFTRPPPFPFFDLALEEVRIPWPIWERVLAMQTAAVSEGERQ
jgi:hypothetical protein